MIVALCGGVGGSKLVLGLYRALAQDELSVIVNTADDLQLWGLHISPDLDTVTYTLAGMARKDVGWGIEGDTLATLEMLRRYGSPSWFQVGDRDLATSIYRTHLLQQGQSLTHITANIAQSLGVSARILPMTNERVRTRLWTGDRWLEFQEYFVRERHAIPVTELEYTGVDACAPTHDVLTALHSADMVLLVNSNPTLSILPILSLPGMWDHIRGLDVPRIAVSPIIGSMAVTGPAGDLMRLLGKEANARGVAETYNGIIDGIVIDQVDEPQATSIEHMGIRVLCTNIIMRDSDDRVRLAEEILQFGRQMQ